MSLGKMIDGGELERIAADPDSADAALEEAHLHARSASKIAADDPNGAYQLAYDAARKAVMSHMRRVGLRVSKREGGHAITAAYAQVALDGKLGSQLDQMRRSRNRSEYGTAYLRVEDVEQAIAVAEALIARSAE